jgi:pantoate--beta-alanine ligase
VRKVSSVSQMQRLALTWRRRGLKIGLVPTMGYLHRGHLSLVARARKLVGPRGLVVASIYVNPIQFGPAEDLARYPRNLARDLRLCRQAGVNTVFVPNDADVYPSRESGEYSTYVVEEELSRGMEGSSRPGHFRGVTTIVAKLLNIVMPDVAVFGAKDWQQAAIVRRMTHDLNFPVRIVIAPTVREPDGLAMSSRNKYLRGDLRTQARVLTRAITAARLLVRNATRPVPVTRLKNLVRRIVQSASAARLDYVEVFDAQTLVPATRAARGTHLALAVFIGTTRLIDNGRL